MREPGWITKAEAAQLLEVDERTIERRKKAGKIAAREKPGFPTWYWAADVEKLKREGRGEVRTGVLEGGPAANGNGHQGIMVSSPTPSDPYSLAADPIRQLAALVVQALTHEPIGPTGPTGPTLTPSERGAQYVTLADAAAMKGVSERLLLRWIRNGSLPVEREPRSVWTPTDRGWRIQRKDLEQL